MMIIADDNWWDSVAHVFPCNHINSDQMFYHQSLGTILLTLCHTSPAAPLILRVNLAQLSSDWSVVATIPALSLVHSYQRQDVIAMW